MTYDSVAVGIAGEYLETEINSKRCKINHSCKLFFKKKYSDFFQF